MNGPTPSTSERPGILLTLAHLLERLERSTVAVDAEQYRFVARRLAQALEAEPAGSELQAVLSGLPAAAEMYENANYQYAGLCRSPLQAALDAEVRAAELLRRVRRNASGAAAQKP